MKVALPTAIHLGSIDHGAVLTWVQELAKALKRLSGFRNTTVLVISRTLIACGHAAHVSIRKLDVAPAVELLRERCQTHMQLWDPQLAQLAELCGRNALFLTIVGSFINSGRSSIQVIAGPALVSLAISQKTVLVFAVIDYMYHSTSG